MTYNLSQKKRLVVVGATNIDDVLFIDDVLPPDGKVNSSFDAKMMGGGGMNTAIGVHLLNTIFETAYDITLCTKIGKNSEADSILEETEAMDINIVDAFSDYSTTMPQNTVIAHKGGRSIIRRSAFNHASLPISAEREQELRDSIIGASAVFLQTKHPRIAQIAAEAAHENDLPLIVDFSNVECPESLLDNADYALLPAEFHFSDMPANDDAMRLPERVDAKVPYTVVSDAAHPSLRMHNQNVAEVPSNKVKTRDSLGAGDLRDAAFCYFLLRENEPDTALRKANIIASISCEYYGRSWVNKLAERLQDFPEFASDFTFRPALHGAYEI